MHGNICNVSVQIVVSIATIRSDMPIAPRSACRVRTCPRLAENKGYCAEHQRLIPIRAGGTERGYGYKWQKERKAFLSANPVCCACGAPATDVHHVGMDRWPLCHSCHSKATRHGIGWHRGV